jgi:hypothetical protein
MEEVLRYIDYPEPRTGQTVAMRSGQTIRVSRPPYQGCQPPHSHSIVPGGFDVMSYTTRLTPLTSLMMRVAVAPKKAMSKE